MAHMAALAGSLEVAPNDARRPPIASTLLRVVSVVIAPTTFVTAFAYYFGWARTTALYDYFGVDQSTIGLSTQDYLLKSTNALFPAAFAFAALSLVALGLIVAARTALTRAGPGSRRGTGLQIAACLAVGLTGFCWLARAAAHSPWPPVCFSVAVAVLWAVIDARRHAQRLHTQRPSRWTGLGAAAPVITAGLVGVIVLGGLFSALSRYAVNVGEGAASEIGRFLSQPASTRGDRYSYSKPGVRLYSKSRLGIAEPSLGIVETEVTTDEKGFQFRYSGLRLLNESGGHYFLLPVGWTRSRGVVIVLRDNDESIRLDYTVGTS